MSFFLLSTLSRLRERKFNHASPIKTGKGAIHHPLSHAVGKGAANHALSHVAGEGTIERKHLNSPHPKHQRGFSIVAAIFILVIMALLGGYMMTLSSVQQSTAGLAVVSARVYQAARTGVEWGIHRAVPPGGGGSCAASTAFPTFSVPGLNSIDLTVTCTNTTHEENGATIQAYLITATATYGTYGDPFFARRQIQVTATDAP